MLNRDKFNKLLVLATGKKPTEAVKQVNQNSKKRGSKVKDDLSKYKGIYADPYTAWTEWYRSNKNELDSNNADDVWDFAESNFPGSRDQAREWLKNEVSTSTNSQDPAINDISLRENLAKSPSWLAEEMMPAVEQNAATVSNQNMTKAKNVYQKTVLGKLQNIDLSELDPDVAIEEHINDIVRLEAAGLANGISVVNGRFAAVSQNGQLVPAFSLNYDNSAIGDGPEIEEMYEILHPVIKPLIESAVSSSRSKMGLNNRAARGAAINMLSSGQMPISEWQNALSLLGDVDGVVDAGIKGIAKPSMTDEEILSASVDINEFKRGYR